MAQTPEEAFREAAENAGRSLMSAAIPMTCKTCGGKGYYQGDCLGPYVCPDCSAPDVAAEIVQAQRHGRQKYGRGPDDLAHDDTRASEDWFSYIYDHFTRAKACSGMDRREHLVKVAGLCKSAVEAFDRRSQWWKA